MQKLTVSNAIAVLSVIAIVIGFGHHWVLTY